MVYVLTVLLCLFAGIGYASDSVLVDTTRDYQWVDSGNGVDFYFEYITSGEAGPELVWMKFETDEGTNYINDGDTGIDAFAPAANNEMQWLNLYGGAVTNDNSDDVATFYTNLNPLATTTASTITAWIYPAVDNQRHSVMFVGGGNVGTPGFWVFRRASSGDGTIARKMIVYYRNDGGSTKGLEANTEITAGKWWFVTLTSDSVGSTNNIYVNGYQDVPYVAYSTWSDGTTPRQITVAAPKQTCFGGTYYDGGYGNQGAGMYGEIREYDRILSLAEITNLFDEAKSTYGY